jgi:aspartate aminotransferase/aminotransferase
MNKLKFSDRMQRVKQARSIYINELVYSAKRAGKNPIVLSLGEAYFDIPNYGINDEVVLGGYHYSDSQGLPALRRKISEYLFRVHSAKEINADDNVIISGGSKLLTYMSMLITLNDEDEVLLHEPAWLSYEDQASLCGATVRYLPYQYSLKEISDSFSDVTKLVVINNPNNPAGWIYDFDSLKNMIALAEEKGIYVLVDEAYSEFTRGQGFHSVTSLVRKYSNLIVVNSISKNFGMSGWRIGFAVADREIIAKLKVANQHLITCAPTMLQQYVEKNFDEIWNTCNKQIHELLNKRQKVRELLNKYEFRVLDGDATFYFFVELCPPGINSSELAEKLLVEDGVALVPGEAYGKTTSHFVRLSFGTESLERIETALCKIKERIQV